MKPTPKPRSVWCSPVPLILVLLQIGFACLLMYSGDTADSGNPFAKFAFGISLWLSLPLLALLPALNDLFVAVTGHPSHLGPWVVALVIEYFAFLGIYSAIRFLRGIAAEARRTESRTTEDVW